MKKHLTTIILVAILLVGIGIFVYPAASSYVNSLSQSRAVTNYKERVSSLSEEEIAEIFEKAEKYNDALAATSPSSFFDSDKIAGYNDILNITGTGIMAYVSIPSISVELPVYHTTDEAVLQVGIGHLQGTSLPIGGIDTHAVLSGHRGLPSSTLFTDLDKLEEGDIFTLTTLDRTITYQIDRIRIVEPDDVEDLMIVDGKDYCTLFTCTPYGINSHRLLLRGNRIDNLSSIETVNPDARQVDVWVATLAIGIPLLTLALLAIVLRNRKRRQALEAQTTVMENLGFSDAGKQGNQPTANNDINEKSEAESNDSDDINEEKEGSEEETEGMEDRS